MKNQKKPAVKSAATKTKKCSMCGKVKPLSEFHARTGSPDGHRGYCKECAAKAERARRAKQSAEKHSARLVKEAKQSLNKGIAKHKASEQASLCDKVIAAVTTAIRNAFRK